jgi:hypothetical protein
MANREATGHMPNSAADPLPTLFSSLNRAADSADGRPTKIAHKILIYNKFTTSKGHKSSAETGFFPELREERTR